MVAKGLFLTKRRRQDIEPTIAFLCTRVKKPTQQDWNKLSRMMTFLNQTKKDAMTLTYDGSGVIKWYWYVDELVQPHVIHGVTWSGLFPSILAKNARFCTPIF